MATPTLVALATALFWQRVSAHGLVAGLLADGVNYQGYNPNMQYQNPAPQVVGWSIPQDQSLGFVSDLSSTDIVCHIAASPAPISAKATAGSNVTLYWTPWPESHHGPMLTYMAACPDMDCTKLSNASFAQDLSFFKIDEAGLVDGSSPPGTWADDQMIANNNSWTVRIPSSITPGGYVMRHETIALHSAGSQGGAQAYPFCVNLDVASSGTDKPAGVLGTELYKAADPGILVNIYTKMTNYTIPGPVLYKGT